MSTFESTPESLKDILTDICSGKIQLPDFQRGWVWDDDHIQDLLVSVARSFPVGALMMLATGGEVQFKTRPVEGVGDSISQEPEKLILDGQQRLTTLTQALAITTPVKTRTNKGKKIDRHYYFDIKTAMDSPHDLESAIVAVDANRQIMENFNRDIVLDLSSRDKECEQLHFPCDQVMNSNEWDLTLHRIAPDEHISLYHDFKNTILESFRTYKLPVIKLLKETSKKAVCLVFEKVNTGGVQLNVFELLTALYAADDYKLRDDWFGSEDTNVPSRRECLAEDDLLGDTEKPDFLQIAFLQAVTLLHTQKRKAQDIQDGKTGKKIRPVSAKREDILELPLSAWKELAGKVESGFKLVRDFLNKESFYSGKDLPYSTQIVPLAAVLSQLGERGLEPRIYEKLSQWFWCGILGQLYGSSIETRISLDFEQLLEWIDNDDSVPKTINDAIFQPEKFYTLKTRQSALYKGINTLIVREGAKDWLLKVRIKQLYLDEKRIDIHHIFPKAWCKAQSIPVEKYDCILNKTPMSKKANVKIGGDAPYRYLNKIQRDPDVRLDDAAMDELVESHAIRPSLLRADDFDGFITDRSKRLCKLIEKAMGKPVVQEPSDE